MSIFHLVCRCPIACKRPQVLKTQCVIMNKPQHISARKWNHILKFFHWQQGETARFLSQSHDKLITKASPYTIGLHRVIIVVDMVICLSRLLRFHFIIIIIILFIFSHFRFILFKQFCKTLSTGKWNALERRYYRCLYYLETTINHSS